MTTEIDIDNLTVGQAREIAAMFSKTNASASPSQGDAKPAWTHPLLGKRVLVRTYSAGVHIGTLASVNPDNAMECHLVGALRLWKWENGGLSLSAVAHNGIKGGRLNRTDCVTLTNAIEYIPVTAEAWASYEKFIED